MSKFAGLRVKSFWKAETVDKDGRIISLSDFVPNVMTGEGLTLWMEIMFKGRVTDLLNWRVMIFSDNASPTAGSTYASKGVTEYSGYTESLRPVFQSGSVASQQLSNTATPALFSMTDNVTIFGAGLVLGSSTKGDSAAAGAVLMAAAKFAAPQVLANGVVLRVTASVTAQDG